jgi:hypothetical protein
MAGMTRSSRAEEGHVEKSLLAWVALISDQPKANAAKLRSSFQSAFRDKATPDANSLPTSGTRLLNRNKRLHPV